MSIDEMIAVLEAAKAGKEIEYSSNGITEWEVMPNPGFTEPMYKYRVKREPREGWISPIWLESKKHDWIKVREVLE